MPKGSLGKDLENIIMQLVLNDEFRYTVPITRPWEKLETDISEFMGFGLARNPLREPRTYIVDINSKAFLQNQRIFEV